MLTVMPINVSCTGAIPLAKPAYLQPRAEKSQQYAAPKGDLLRDILDIKEHHARASDLFVAGQLNAALVKNSHCTSVSVGRLSGPRPKSFEYQSSAAARSA
jgi:hypothetical protein